MNWWQDIKAFPPAMHQSLWVIVALMAVLAGDRFMVAVALTISSGWAMVGYWTLERRKDLHAIEETWRKDHRWFP